MIDFDTLKMLDELPSLETEIDYVPYSWHDSNGNSYLKFSYSDWCDNIDHLQ